MATPSKHCRLAPIPVVTAGQLPSKPHGARPGALTTRPPLPGTHQSRTGSRSKSRCRAGLI